MNDTDYLGIITQEALSQMTRGNSDRFIQAEESAEMSIVEHLSENYEIERELGRGKYIAEYDRRITFPVGAHIYHEGTICEVIRSISGYKMPSVKTYWQEHVDVNLDTATVERYSQLKTYYPNDLVQYNGVVYICTAENGYKFGEIRIPMVEGWLEAEYTVWQPINYLLWNVVEFSGAFYTLISMEGFDNNATPMESDCWGAIADYDPAYNEYEFSEHEYVV